MTQTPNYNTMNSSAEQDDGLGHVMGTAGGRDYQQVHINTEEDEDFDEDEIQQQKNLNINLK